MVTRETHERRSERLEVRVPPSLHSRATRAAALRGQTLAAFVTAAVQDAAQHAIDSAEITELNRADFDRLLSTLDNGVEPNAALRVAAARHHALSANRA